MVDQENGDLAAVPGIDETGAVDHSHAETTGMSAARKDQARETLGYGHGETGGHRGPLPRLETYVVSGLKVDRRIADMRSRGYFHFRIESFEISLHVGVTGHRAG
jgi:hypothetical protein